MPPSGSRPAHPTRSIFDPFNSSSTGHQQTENRLGASTSWRDSRNHKLREQYKGGAGGGKRINDTVGAGSLDFGADGRTVNGGRTVGAKGSRTRGQSSIWESFAGIQVKKGADRPAKRRKVEPTSPPRALAIDHPFPLLGNDNGAGRETSRPPESSPSHLLSPLTEVTDDPSPIDGVATNDPSPTEADVNPHRPIFAHLTFYINGSTAPAISDHRLKYLISSHGGRLSVSLGRRTVSHVIIGNPSTKGGCGGGLAGRKIQKEVAAKGNRVKFVTTAWVLESIKAGKRLPESRFAGLKFAPKGVRPVSEMLPVQSKGSMDTARRNGREPRSDEQS